MKITAAIFSIILQSSHAALYTAQYGGCLNATKHASSDTAGRGSSFHCHFTSDACLDGEDWLTPTEVSLEGLKCTCDDDYNQNVFTMGCYDMFNTHAVTCVADQDDCPADWYALGLRYGASANVDEECKEGSAAFSEDGNSCGKQCLCNYAYQSRTDEVTIGSSTYGKCENEATGVTYCAATKSTCADGEVFHQSHSAGFPGEECNCNHAKTGACMTGKALSYCAVAEDSCGDSMSFVKAMDLPSGVDCRLCSNTWDPPTEAPTPTPIPCIDDHKFRYQGKKKKSCKWIDAKDKRTNNLCKKTKVFDACQIVCGDCCADDMTRTFKVEGADKDCTWLWSAARKKDHCVRGQVNSVCAATCGRCCSNDKEFEFNIGTASAPKLKKCGWFKKKGRAKKWCAKESSIADACQKSCDSCVDYTIAATDAPVPAPVTAPVKPPVKPPVAAPVGGDDD